MMGKKKRARRSFSPTSTVRMATWNIGHTWFSQSKNDTENVIDVNDASENYSDTSGDRDGANISGSIHSNEDVHMVDVNDILTSHSDTDSDSEDDSCKSEHDDQPRNDQSGASVSAKKIKFDVSMTKHADTDIAHGIFDFAMLQESFDHVLPLCSVCEVGKLKIVITKHVGLATEIAYICSNSDCAKNVITKDYSFSMSKRQGQKYDINKSLVLAMREIGRGHTAANRFCISLGLPKPVSNHPYSNYNKEWCDHSTDVCEQSMKAAADELRQQLAAVQDVQDEQCDDTDKEEDNNDTVNNDISDNNGDEYGDEDNNNDTADDDNTDNNKDEDSEDEDGDDIKVLDCAVSVDGSWLTRGHHSRHGFVSVISDLTGKVIDCIHMCSDCVECKRWEQADQSGIDYLEWYTAHEPKCLLNHTGSPQAMESAGALQLFRRSMEKYALRYKTYIGDGDAKSYDTIVKAAPYGPTYVILKEECAGHVQKRMGTRLRNVVSHFKGKTALSVH